MKFMIIATASAAALCAAAPAMAQTASAYGLDLSHPSYYGSLGDSYLSTNHDGGVDEITGRVGARFGNWGLEGEIGGGLSEGKVSNASGNSYTTQPIAGAGYVVGFLPVAPNLDLLARAGYGESNFHQTVNGVSSSGDTHSANFGVGAQYWLTGNDAVRIDYTRRDYLGGSQSPIGADAYALSFVRKF
ncbi:MAG TPA: outer membrane beta-barrel protein [Caulobacteraceae bacterium]|nr:outer membrane beta-barrel protein [Caulobacteraceae bacterium]